MSDTPKRPRYIEQMMTLRGESVEQGQEYIRALERESADTVASRPCSVVNSDFARTLERENAELRARLDGGVRDGMLRAHDVGDAFADKHLNDKHLAGAIAVLSAIRASAETLPADTVTVPREPTRSQWVDFCTASKAEISLVQFLRGYKAMLAAAEGKK